MKNPKFRVWDSNNKNYIKNLEDYYLTANGILKFFDEALMEFQDFKAGKLEIYTFANDMNGNEMYLGDIVKIGVYENEIYEITWDDLKGFYLKSSSGDENLGFNSVALHDFKVVGNINENKDLL
jgi:hypothetical protein